MATSNSLTTTYAGQVAGDYILQAMKEMKSLDFITVRDNIDGKQVVRKLVNAITFAAQTCEVSPTGTVTLTERLITLEWFQVQEKICKTDFNFDWNNPDAPGFPDGFEDAFLANMLAGIAANEERILWIGVNATVGEHDGFITLMVADSDVIDVGSPLTLSASNIIQELTDLLNASLASTQGPALHGSTEKPEFYISVTAAAFYQQAMATLGFNYQWQAGTDYPLNFMTYKLNVCPGMPANTMVMAQPSNLWFGTNKLAAKNDIQILDLQKTTGDKAVLFSADFAFAVQYGFGNEITLYGTGT